MIPELISREHSRQARLRAEHFTTYQKALERDNFQSVLEAYHCVNKTDPTCPNINRATLTPPGPTVKTTIPPVKTTIPPVKTTIPPEKNTGATEENTEATEENTGSTKENTENSTPESLGSTKKAFDEYEEQKEEKKEAYEKLKEEDLYIPAFMSDDSENDIIASFLKFIYVRKFLVISTVISDSGRDPLFWGIRTQETQTVPKATWIPFGSQAKGPVPKNPGSTGSWIRWGGIMNPLEPSQKAIF
uniref:Uncharacterized protein n=1 Tax=Acrobeloides nanus TaxID=290746 RepID=A0A914BYG2_9BILA